MRILRLNFMVAGVVGGLLCSPPLMAAAGSDRCDSALLPQITVSSSSTSERAAYLSLITESNYEQARAGGALNIVIDDLPIGASYEQFNEKRRNYLSQQHFTYNRSEARALLRQSLLADQLQAWTSCMTSDVPGVRILLSDDDKDGVAAEVHYVEASGRSKQFQFSVAGGYVIGSPASTSFILAHGGSKGFIVKRATKTSRIRFLVNGSNMTDSAISLPPPPPPPPLPWRDCQQVSLLSAHAPVTALVENPSAGAITDGNTDPGNWNCLCRAPQWIEIDLTGPRRVRYISLNPEQTPGGYTQHRIYGKRPDGTQVFLGEYNGPTISGGIFTVLVDPRVGDNVRFVRVETISSPSAVSWREIEVYGCQ